MNKFSKLLVNGGPPTIITVYQLHLVWTESKNIVYAIRDTISFSLTILFLSLLVKFVNKFYENFAPNTENAAAWLAKNSARILRAFFKELIANCQSYVSRFQKKYYQYLLQTYRRYQTKGLKLSGPVALELEKVFIPLRVAPQNQVSPDIIPVKDRQKNQAQKKIARSREIWDFIEQIPTQPTSRRMVILGSPGSGKTTILQYITLTYAKGAQHYKHKKAPKLIPVLLYLRDIRHKITNDNPPSLAKIIQNQDSIKRLNPPPQWFERNLRSGKCLVMLDGLDEVADPTERQQVSRWIIEQMKVKYPSTAFILTSRPFGYENSGLETLVETVLGVQSYNLQDMRQFIQGWYLQTEIAAQGELNTGIQDAAIYQANNLIERIEKSPPLAAMALNPLLLTMIATVHHFRGALPGRRVELYAEICDVLLARRQQAKGISDRLSAAQKESVLQVLALDLMILRTREFTLDKGISIIREKLLTVAGKQDNPDVFAEEFLQQIRDFSGLLVEREMSIYEFAHHSFQEYLAAAQIKNLNQGDLLIGKIKDPWCHETIRLYAAQADATPIIRAALESESVEALALAYDCQEEGLSVATDVQEQLEQRLTEGLKDSNPQIVAFAAQVKLKRRLSKLLRLDDCLEIDRSYITCAEYQVFLDDKSQASENREPAHWQTERFPDTNANQPITGIRAGDAEAFCQWLTEWDSEPVFQYRLPKIAEFEQNLLDQKQVGGWCYGENRKVIAGIDSTQKSSWRISLEKALERDCAQARILVQTHAEELTLNSSLARELWQPIAAKLVQIPVNENYLNLLWDEPAIVLAKDYSLAQIYKFTRIMTQELFAYIKQVIDLVPDVVPTLTSEFAESLHHKFDSSSNLVDLRVYVLFVSSLWWLLSEAYINAASRDNICWRSKNLKRQDLEKLIRESAEKSEGSFALYSFLLLIYERREDKLPAWEGIRIIRERLLS